MDHRTDQSGQRAAAWRRYEPAAVRTWPHLLMPSRMLSHSAKISLAQNGW